MSSADQPPSPPVSAASESNRHSFVGKTRLGQIRYPFPAPIALKSFAWSSWPAYLLPRSKRPAWFRVDRLLGEWGIPEDSPAGRQRL